MARQESFKRRVRARMEKTGERYSAARQALIERSERADGRRWISEPETSDAAVAKATGRTWNQWCDLIDEWVGNRPDPDKPVPDHRVPDHRVPDHRVPDHRVPDHRVPDHRVIGAYLIDEVGVDPWWAQTVTGGYERISGLRLPYQRPDGTFTAGRSATMAVDGPRLRAMLLDDDDRADLIPGQPTELRSRPDAKRIRIGLEHGVVQLSIDPAKPSADQPNRARYRISVSHEKLATFDEVEPWKQYWQEWLDTIATESAE